MPPNERQKRGQRAAARHLRVLLLQQEPYRGRWEARAHSTTPGEVNQAAVCQVVAQHLWETGERSEHDESVPRSLKDRVHRVFAGEDLSLETLRWIADAFRLSPHDAQRVFALYRGEIPSRLVVGQLLPPDPASGIRAPDHQTALLFEHHCIGPSGLPARHHTQQKIVSLTDGLESYQYRTDTAESQIRVRRGGTPGQVYEFAKGYYAVDITFPHPLSYGEEHYLDYWTLFHYQEPPKPEFRRGTHQRVEHLEMRVEFHESRLPGRLWWAQWEDYRDLHRGFVEREAMTLDEECSACKYLDAIEHTVVGFYWEW